MKIVSLNYKVGRGLSADESPPAAGYPIILTIVGLLVRKVTIVGFLDSFTMGKWVFPS